jgi:hypothetical protein
LTATSRAPAATTAQANYTSSAAIRSGADARLCLAKEAVPSSDAASRQRNLHIQSTEEQCEVYKARNSPSLAVVPF